MEFILSCLVVLLMLFAFVIFFGAPYLPTLKPQVTAAFELLELGPGQTLLELGSGDGKVLLAAAQAGYKAVGIELNPLLVLASYWRTRHYRKLVKIHWGNYWHMTWPEADGVFVFLLDRFMPKLDERMRSYRKPLASVAFQIPGKTPRQEKNGVFLYEYWLND